METSRSTPRGSSHSAMRLNVARKVLNIAVVLGVALIVVGAALVVIFVKGTGDKVTNNYYNNSPSPSSSTKTDFPTDPWEILQNKNVDAAIALYENSLPANYAYRADDAQGNLRVGMFNADPNVNAWATAGCLFLEMAPGYDSGWHTHNFDYDALVLMGTHAHIHDARETFSQAHQNKRGDFFDSPAMRCHADSNTGNEKLVILGCFDGPYDYTPSNCADDNETTDPWEILQNKNVDAAIALYENSLPANYAYRADDAQGNLRVGMFNADPNVNAWATAGCLFLEMAPGYDSGWHTHNFDYDAIVLKGTHAHIHDASETFSEAHQNKRGDFFDSPALRCHADSNTGSELLVILGCFDGPYDYTPGNCDGDHETDPLMAIFGTPERFQGSDGQFGWTEGPIWHPRHKKFYFSDVPNANLWTFDPVTDKFDLFVDNAGSNPADGGWKAESGSNGLALSPTDDNIIFVAQHGARRIAKLDLTTRQFTNVVDNYQGFKLNSPNDLVFTSDNKFYFTDPPFGLMVKTGETSPLYASTSFGDGWWLDAASETGIKGVYSVDLSEDTPTATLLTGGITRPNGICHDSDGDGSFYIAETATPLALPTDEGRLYKLDSSGAITGYFAWPSAIPTDGVECTKLGGSLRILTTHDNGVVIVDPSDGSILGTIETEARTSNIAIGDDYMLFTGLNGVWKIPILN